MKEVSFSHISIVFTAGSRTDFLLSDINCSFYPGLNVIVGPSGSGKSTLLNILSGTVSPLSGSVLFDGKEINRDNDFYGKALTYMVTERNEIPSLSAQDNLRLVSSKETKIEEALRSVSLFSSRKTKVSKLSKGERARLAIAKSLLVHAEVACFDEPTANLDEESSLKVFSLLKHASKDEIVIIVTHDMKMVQQFADRIYQIDHGALSLVKEGRGTASLPKRRETEKKPPKLPYLKLGFRKAFKKKFLAFFSIGLFTLSLLAAFVGLASALPNEEKTYASSIASLSGDFYSCKDSSLTKEVGPLSYYKSLGNGSPSGMNTFSLSTGLLDDVKVGIYEAMGNTVPLNASPDSSSSIASFIDTDQIVYYPISLSEALVSYLSTQNGIDYAPGDILPLSFDAFSPDIEEKFVLSSTFKTTDNLSKVSSLPGTNYCPGIISQASLLKHLHFFGFSDSHFVDSLTELAQKYNDFVDQNNLDGEYHLDATSFFGISSFRTADYLKASFYSSLDQIPASGGYLLTGHLPTRDEEIVVPSENIYQRLGVDHPTALDPFFSLYPDGFSLNAFSEMPSSLDVPAMKIVGSYCYVEGARDSQNIFSSGGVLIGRSLYDKATSFVSDENYLPNYPASTNTVYSKAYLAKASSRLSDGSLTVYSNEVDSFPYLIENTHSMAIFLSSVSLFLSLGGLLVSTLYLSKVLGDLQADFAVLHLWGVSKKRLILSFLSSVLSLLLPSLAIAIGLGYPFYLLIASSETKALGYAGVLSCDFAYGYLLLIGIFLLLSLLCLLPLFKKSNSQKAYRILKNE